MHWLVVVLVGVAPALWLWDVAHDSTDEPQGYLALWAVCLSIAALIKVW